MSVLPETLFSTYKGCKNDTAYVASWLLPTAKSCGYRSKATERLQSDVSASTGPKLKGRARTLARNAGKSLREEDDRSIPAFDVPDPAVVIVAVGELIVMATTIAKCKTTPISVPTSFVRAAERAINARQKCTAWFTRNASNEDDKTKNAGHVHFIEVLEKVLEILRPRFSAPEVPRKLGTTETSHVDVKSAGDTLPNRFDALQVKDTTSVPSDHFWPDTGQSPDATTGRNPKVHITIDETCDGEDLLFACFCLLTDLNDIRSFVRALWLRNKQKQIPLMVASLTTKAALDLATALELDFEKQFPDQTDYETTMVNFLYRTACDARKVPFSVDFSAQNLHGDLCGENMGDIHEWLFMPTWYMLHKLGCLALVTEKDLLQIFVINPELSDHQIPSSRVKIDEFLAALKPIFCGSYKYLEASPPFWTEDQFTARFREWVTKWTRPEFENASSKRGKGVSLGLTFAAQIMVDVHQCVGSDLGRSLDELDQVALSARASIEDHRMFLHTQCEGWKTNFPYFSEAFDYIVGLANQVINDTWLEPPVSVDSKDDKTSYVRTALAQNPVFCGLTAAYITDRLHFWGLRMIDSRQCVTRLAHLHNAVSSEATSRIEWPDMEALLSMVGTHHVFIGEPPKQRSRYWRHLLISCGMSINQLSGNRRSSSAVGGQSGKVKHLSPGQIPLTRFLMQQIITSAWDNPAITDLALITKTIIDPRMGASKIQQDAVHITLTNRHELWKKTRRSGKESPSQLLASVETCLVKEIPGMAFDYFAMSRRCFDLAGSIMQSLTDQGFRNDWPTLVGPMSSDEFAWTDALLCDFDANAFSVLFFSVGPESVTTLEATTAVMTAWLRKNGSIGVHALEKVLNVVDTPPAQDTTADASHIAVEATTVSPSDTEKETMRELVPSRLTR